MNSVERLLRPNLWKIGILLTLLIFGTIIFLLKFYGPKFNPWYHNSLVEFNYSHYGSDWPYEEHLTICNNGRVIYTTDGKWITRKLTDSEFNYFKERYKQNTTKSTSKDFRYIKELSKIIESIRPGDLIDRKQQVAGLNFDYSSLCSN